MEGAGCGIIYSDLPALLNQQGQCEEERPCHSRDGTKVISITFEDPLEANPELWSVDEDGDLELNRSHRSTVLRIGIHAGTDLPSVGLQLWSGSLILADYLLQTYIGRKCTDCSMIELGCGVGLTALVASRLQIGTYFATDYRAAILDLCAENLEANDGTGVIVPRLLDWKCESIPMKDITRSCYGWEESDKEMLQDCSVILCADCIYDIEATGYLFAKIQELVTTYIRAKTKPEVWFSVEKRENFYVSSLSVECPAYDDFINRLEQWKEEGFAVSEQIDLEGVPSRFNYKRTDDMILWKCTVTPMEL